jgi:hypothetical protein
VPGIEKPLLPVVPVYPRVTEMSETYVPVVLGVVTTSGAVLPVVPQLPVDFC